MQRLLAWFGRAPRRVLLGTLSGVVILTGVAAPLALSGSAGSAEVLLEPMESVGPNPFLELVTNPTRVEKFRPPAARKTEAALIGISGDTAGLYGGSLNEGVCDRDQIAKFLAQNPAKAAAWAKVHKIKPADIPKFLATLTPVQLRTDTKVTNHGFESGEATSRQTVLQAGTSVLVDRQGVPRVRCFCGNPLIAPELSNDPRYTGTKWADFDGEEVFSITPGKDSATFVLHDAQTGQTFVRPAGTNGEADRALVQQPGKKAEPQPKKQEPPAELVTIPDGLVGVSQTDATKTLQTAGFAVRVEELQDTAKPAGEVLEVKPKSGQRLVKGASVTLVVSSGGNLPKPPPNVVIPPVLGLSEPDAAALLVGAGVKPNGEFEPNDSVARGLAVRTDPPAGAEVLPGTLIRLLISAGPSEEPKVTVPDVVGTQETAARQAMTQAGLVADVARQESSRPAGEVLSTDPVAGTAVSPRSAVRVTVSSGPSTSPTDPRVTVPNLVNRAEADAASALRQANLAGSLTREASPTAPRGQVMRQDPASGSRVSPGTTVFYVVSSGPTPTPPVTVPDLVGQTDANAAAILQRVGLAPSVTRENSTAPAGQVIRQEPAAGSQVSPGSTVRYVVSTGPVPVTVPDVVGRADTEAKSILGGANLGMSITQQSSTQVPAGIVMSQSPVGGSSVTAGSTVSVVVSSGPELVTVPDGVGQNQGSAKKLIESAGFGVVIKEERNDKVEEGTVLRQDPRGGSNAPRGSTVTLTIAVGMVRVPDLVGYDERAAVALLQDLGFFPTVERVVNDAEPANQVYAQRPPAGSLVARGSNVLLLVAIQRR